MGHPLQIIRVKKVTGNLNFLWLINTSYSKLLAVIWPVYREVEDSGRWGNSLRWDNPPVHVISRFNLNQEPISWNEQLPRRFHGPVSFQNGFGANLEHPLSPTNQSAKPTVQLMTLRFRFWYLYTSNAFIAWWIFHFRVKNCPKMCLKINRSVKTPWHRPSVEVARSGLWAAVWTRWHKYIIYFFDERQNVQQKPQIFWKHGVVPFHAGSFQLIRTRSVRGACGRKREDEFWSLLFYWRRCGVCTGTGV